MTMARTTEDQAAARAYQFRLPRQLADRCATCAHVDATRRTLPAAECLRLGTEVADRETSRCPLYTPATF